MPQRAKLCLSFLRRLGSEVWCDCHSSARIECRRSIRTPLGGFTEDLPSSLGSNTRKDGELSTVNLRSKRLQRERLQRSRTKLHFPCNERQTGQETAQNAVLGSVLCRSPACALTDVDAMNDAPGKQGSPIRWSLPSRVSDKTSSSCSHEFSFASLRSDDGSTALCTRMDEMTLERRFAVTPASTVFGSDLDRLERDILRDHHQQQAGKLPRLDEAFSRFGAGRAGRRLTWEPSSSLAKMNTADVTSRVRALHRYGSRDNHNLAARLMHAESYLYAETTRRKAIDGHPHRVAGEAVGETQHHTKHRSDEENDVLTDKAHDDDIQERQGDRVDGTMHCSRRRDRNTVCQSETVAKRRLDKPSNFAVTQDATKSSNKDDDTNAHVCEAASLPLLSSDESSSLANMREHFPCTDEDDSDGLKDDADPTAAARGRNANASKHEHSYSLLYEARVREWYKKRCGAPHKAVSYRTVHAVRKPRIEHKQEGEMHSLTHTGENNNNNKQSGSGTGSIVYDAFCQRPAEDRLRTLRGAEYWSDERRRECLEQHTAQHTAEVQREMLQEGVMQTSRVEHSTNLLRKETFLYFQAHPINEMIQESFVRIRQIVSPYTGHTRFITYSPSDARQEGEDECASAEAASEHSRESPWGSIVDDESDGIVGRNEDVDVCTGEDEDEEGLIERAVRVAGRAVHTQVDIPVQEARQMAHALGVDVIRVGAHYTQKSDRRVVAICILADHRVHMREMIRFKMQRVGVQPPTTPACIEVGFRGGTHPHAIRFKCVGIAKHILHGHMIRINLTKFGTPHEGFPVLQTVLDEVKRQCLQLHAYHRAGVIQSNYDEIFLYLYPSTGRSPKTSVEHPSQAQMTSARDYHVACNEKEIYFDDLHGQLSARRYRQYVRKVEEGTAWADKDAGLSLQRQRALKVMLGYLPKGNGEIYAARGDVNVPAPFRSTHPTSVDAWTHPRESNLEQASRGAAVLGKRLAMPISEMHDRGETAEEPTVIDRFYYRAQGPVLEVGELKEALGLKNNRRKTIPLGPGFATLGMARGGASTAPPSQATR